jgi:hypothetical protein
LHTASSSHPSLWFLSPRLIPIASVRPAAASSHAGILYLRSAPPPPPVFCPSPWSSSAALAPPPTKLGSPLLLPHLPPFLPHPHPHWGAGLSRVNTQPPPPSKVDPDAMRHGRSRRRSLDSKQKRVALTSGRWCDGGGSAATMQRWSSRSSRGRLREGLRRIKGHRAGHGSNPHMRVLLDSGPGKLVVDA